MPISAKSQILETELSNGSTITCIASDGLIASGSLTSDQKSFYTSIDAFEQEKVEVDEKKKKLRKKRRRLRRKIKRGNFKRRRKRKMRQKIKDIRTEMKSFEGYLLEREAKMNAENEACTVRVLSPYSGRANASNFYKQTISRDEARHLLRKLVMNDISFIEDGASDYNLEELVNNILNPNNFSKDLKRMLETFRDGITGDQYRGVLPFGRPEGGNYYVFEEDEQFDTLSKQKQGLDTFTQVYLKGYNPNTGTLHYGNSFTSPIHIIYGRYLSSIQAKMSHIWLGHFGTSWTKPDTKNEREYFDLIYDNSLGSFRHMVLGTTDDACLEGATASGTGILCDVASGIWLDHHLNTVEDRNQNYARELMELYLLGPTDYFTGQPNYTEVDVVASTAFTSGFRLTSETVPIELYDGPQRGATTKRRYFLSYETDRHDNQAWAAFQGTSYEFRGPATPTDFVAHIFDNHPGMPRFIAGKLFRMLAHQNPSEELIDSLAHKFKESNFNISALLYSIATSEAMFSDAAYERSCIKSPVEQYLELSRNLQMPLVATNSLRLSNTHHNWGGVINRLRSQGNLVGVNSLLNQAGEKSLLYDSVFTYDYCGRDADAVGGDWLHSIKMLYRTKNMIELVGMAQNYNHYIFDFADRIDLIAKYTGKQESNLEPQDFIDFFEYVYDVELAANEESVLLRYLKREMQSDGTMENVEWDINNSSFLMKKIAGLAAIFLDMSITNVK